MKQVRKITTIKLDIQDIWASMRSSIYTSKKSYSRKIKHKK